MADLTDACCSTEAQSTCCEPDAKDACCGTAAPGGSCGCAEGQVGLALAGFGDIEIRETHRVHEHAASAIIRARVPA